jgi:AmmeMemoRadiSam system protein A
MSSPETTGARVPHGTLCKVAREAIAFGLDRSRPPELDTADYPAPLRTVRASFVTLQRGGQLRGCTGSLEATRPVVVDVAWNAWRSAFRDPRFPPLALHELEGLDVSVSLLSPLEPLSVDSEAALLAALRPGVDGLVLLEGAKRATFLPAVWESLPAPKDFLAQLIHKAGLPADYWSTTLRFERYTVDPAP